MPASEASQADERRWQRQEKRFAFARPEQGAVQEFDATVWFKIDNRVKENTVTVTGLFPATHTTTVTATGKLTAAVAAGVAAAEQIVAAVAAAVAAQIAAVVAAG